MSATITASSAADELLDTMRALLAGHHDDADLDELDTLADKLGKAVSTAKRRARALRKRALPKPTPKAEPKPSAPTNAVATPSATPKPQAEHAPQQQPKTAEIARVGQHTAPPKPQLELASRVPPPTKPPVRLELRRLAVVLVLVVLGVVLGLSPTGYAVAVFVAIGITVGALIVHTKGSGMFTALVGSISPLKWFRRVRAEMALGATIVQGGHVVSGDQRDDASDAHGRR